MHRINTQTRIQEALDLLFSPYSFFTTYGRGRIQSNRDVYVRQKYMLSKLCLSLVRFFFALYVVAIFGITCALVWIFILRNIDIESLNIFHMLMYGLFISLSIVTSIVGSALSFYKFLQIAKIIT